MRMADKDEIVLPENVGFRKVYIYEPYTYHRIVKILKDGNLYLHPIVWYKCNRIPNYKQHYHVKELGTNRIVRDNVSLDDLREILARLDYPLKEPEVPTRNKGAEAFLNAVKKLQEREKKYEDE